MRLRHLAAAFGALGIPLLACIADEKVDATILSSPDASSPLDGSGDATRDAATAAETGTGTGTTTGFCTQHATALLCEDFAHVPTGSQWTVFGAGTTYARARPDAGGLELSGTTAAGETGVSYTQLLPQFDGNKKLHISMFATVLAAGSDPTRTTQILELSLAEGGQNYGVYSIGTAADAGPTIEYASSRNGTILGGAAKVPPAIGERVLIELDFEPTPNRTLVPRVRGEQLPAGTQTQFPPFKNPSISVGARIAVAKDGVKLAHVVLEQLLVEVE